MHLLTLENVLLTIHIFDEKVGDFPLLEILG